MSKLTRLFSPEPPPAPPAPPPPPPQPENFLPHLYASREHLERISTHLARTLVLGDGTILCRVLGQHLCYVLAQDQSLTPHLTMSGFWESWITLAMRRIIQPGWHCVDGGANVGYFTLLLADSAGLAGKVASFEANPQLSELLARTVNINGMDNRVQVFHNALGATVGETLNLFIPSRLMGSATLNAPPTADSRKVEVRTITLDAALQDWPRVDFIKLDIEGAEWQAWKGMQETIQRNRDIVIVTEFQPSNYQNPAEFLAAFQAAGFELRYIDFHSNLAPITAAEILQPGADWKMLHLKRPAAVRPTIPAQAPGRTP